MRRHRFAVRAAQAALSLSLLSSAGALAGCKDPECDGGSGECEACANMPEAPDPSAVVPQVCTRRIAIDPNGVCPPFTDAGGGAAWEGAPLFPGATKGKLSQYCRYDWQVAGTPPDSTLLPLQSSEDCTFVGPQQVDPITAWAHDSLLASASTTTAGPRPEADPPEVALGGMHVRVLVLDTAPDSDPALAIEQGFHSRHGDTLAHLIRDVACSKAESCSVEVKTALVMPEVLHQGSILPAPAGGNVGRLGDVAQALWTEIASFRTDLDAAAAALPDPADALALPTRLVLNESFAFTDDGTGDACGDDPGSSPRVDVGALFDAFQAAACLGAMHVAAAGNHTGGTTPSEGLLCPARWHRAVEPTQSVCEGLLGTASSQAIDADYAQVTTAKYGSPLPLFVANDDALLSVGAVDHAGTPLVSSRGDACPEAVALGLGGVAWDPGSTNPSVPPILFGTSVSAAVVSARIAAEWAQPGNTASSGGDLAIQVTSTGRYVPFVTGGACTHLAGPACDDLPWIAAPPAGGSAEQNPALGAAASSLTQRQPVVALSVRQSQTQVCAESIPQCARETALARTDLLWGQPTDPLCLKCGVWIDPSAPQALPPELWLEPSGKYQLSQAGTAPGSTPVGVTLVTGAVLVIEDAGGAVIHTEALDTSAMVSSSTVTLDVPGLSLAGARAWLSVYDDQGRSVNQQIFVNP